MADPNADAPPLTFVYRNHEGRVETRKVQPWGVEYGSSIWHPEPQWLMTGYDVVRCAARMFAIRDIIEIEPEEELPNELIERARNLRFWGVRLKTLRELDAAQVEIASLREAAHIGIELENHHNAAMCRYCKGIADVELARREQAEANAEDYCNRWREQRTRAEAAERQVAAAREWSMVNEIAAPPLNWAGLGAILNPEPVETTDNPWLLTHEYVEPENVGALCEFITHITKDGLGTARCNKPREAHEFSEPDVLPCAECGGAPLSCEAGDGTTCPYEGLFCACDPTGMAQEWHPGCPKTGKRS